MSTPFGTINRRRGSALIAFLFHLVMVGMLPAVHAVTESQSLRHLPHLEAQNNGAPCPASHGHAACATCRVLHHSAILAMAVRVADVPAVPDDLTTVSAAVFVPHSIPSGSLGSRAPPFA